MKKILALAISCLMVGSIFAQSMTLNPSGMKSAKVTHDVQWNLDAENGLYTIQNPTHAPLNFIIEVYKGGMNAQGQFIESDPIQVTCGNKVFTLANSITSFGTCATTDDISFALVKTKTSYSNGYFKVEMP